MFTRKINYLWALNLAIFIAVVFLGIQQAGKGADISNLEKKLESVSKSKSELSETIFNNQKEDKQSKILELGFAKPSKVLYFNSIDTVAFIK